MTIPIALPPVPAEVRLALPAVKAPPAQSAWSIVNSGRLDPAFARAEHDRWLKQQAAGYCLSSGMSPGRQIWVSLGSDLGSHPFPSKPSASAELLPFVDACSPVVEQEAKENLESWARMEVAGAAYQGGVGPVHVRSHTRCNISKCWSVRSYWRRR